MHNVVNNAYMSELKHNIINNLIKNKNIAHIQIP